MKKRRIAESIKFTLIFALVLTLIAPGINAASNENERGPLAPELKAVASQGTVGNSTKVNATVEKNHHLVVQVTNQPVPTPKIGSAVPVGSGVTNPYRAGDDIAGVDTSNHKYVSVYEANGGNRVMKYALLTLTEDQINVWSLIWNDEFDRTGNNLSAGGVDLEKWGFQLGTGSQYGLTDWGNNEQQYYREENARVEDGKLILEAKNDGFGGKPYTSTRLFTAETFTKKYGKFEARMKLPQGQGFWPAFWMMPASNVYGGWAASGEIDIMEAKGRLPGQVNGTIHYGRNWPNNKYSGADYLFPDGESMTSFHVYSVEWEPGEIRWYVDGQLYSSKTNWESIGEGQPAKYSFPAPFDQQFYMIMNLAVGGNFDGNRIPDASMFPAAMEVDYVRVYELTGRPYKTPVEPVVPIEDLPENAKTAVDGNYVYDTDYNEPFNTIVTGQEPFNEMFWNFSRLNDFGGAGSVAAETVDGDKFAKVTITNGGAQPYSIQLIQNVTLGTGRHYKLTFDAKASSNRSLGVKMGGGPERGYAAYATSDFALGTQVKNYSFTFQMQESSDARARLEFNIGQNTNTVWIGNVRLEETGDSFDEDGPKAPLGNGNHVYNGTFDLGRVDRMTYWHVATAGEAQAAANVDETTRALTVSVTNGGNQPNAVTLLQRGINLIQGQDYQLSFDGEAGAARSIEVELMSKDGATSYGTQTVNIGTEFAQHTVSFNGIAGSDDEGQLVLHLGGAVGEITVDNVTLIRTSVYIDPSVDLFPLVNGGFDGTLAPWQLINVDGSGAATLHDGSAKVAISAAEGTVPWGILFLQDGLKLSGGVTYTVEFDARSTIARQIQVVLENASFTRFFDQKIDLTNETKRYKFEFKMTRDEIVGLKYLLGKMDGAAAIGTAHDIFIDNVTVEVRDARNIANLLTNGRFDVNNDGWMSYFADFAGVFGSLTAENGELKASINHSGTEFWHVQVEQENVTLEQGKSYRLSFDARSTVPRSIQAIVEHKGGDYTKYLQQTAVLTGDMKTYNYTFTMPSSDAGAHLVFALGQVGNAVTQAHDIYFDNVSLVEVKMPAVQGHPLLNGTFDSNIDGWRIYKNDGSNAEVSAADGRMEVNFPNYDGWFPWSTQVYQDHLQLEAGKTYVLQFDAESTIDKNVKVEVLAADNQHHLGQQDVILSKNGQTFTYEFTVDAADSNAKLAFLLGSNNVPGEQFVTHKIFLDNIRLEPKQ